MATRNIVFWMGAVFSAIGLTCWVFGSWVLQKELPGTSVVFSAFYLGTICVSLGSAAYVGAGISKRIERLEAEIRSLAIDKAER